MDISMFTGFEGRINRAKWWLGTIILVVIAIIINLIIGAVTGASMMGIMGTMMAGGDMVSFARKLAVGQLITIVIIAYPATALMIKRLNDRDRPAYLAYIFWLPTVLSILAGLAGLTMTAAEVNGVSMPGQTTIGWLLSLLSFAVGIWALVELGILKGTTGPNPHGPDPLGA